MKRKGPKLSLIILCAAAVMISGGIFTYNYAGEKYFEVQITSHEDVTEEEMFGVFQTEYGWTDLEDQKLFWDEAGAQVVINYYFAKDAEDWQMESAMEYGLKTFVLKQYLTLRSNPQLYQSWAQEKDITEVVIQAYEAEKLVRQDIYGGIENGIVHEESHFGK